MITEKKRNRLLIIATVVTLLFSFLPSFHADEFLNIEYSTGFDMLQHGGYYFVLTLFLIYINNGYKRWTIWFILIDISILLEICQFLIPGRTFSWYDILANVIGTTTGTLFWYVIDWRNEERKRKRRRSQRRHRSSSSSSSRHYKDGRESGQRHRSSSSSDDGSKHRERSHRSRSSRSSGSGY